MEVQQQYNRGGYGPKPEHLALIKQALSEADQNEDGYLSKLEFGQALEAAAQEIGGKFSERINAESITRLFDHKDTDKDGKLSLDELEPPPYPPFPIQSV